MLLGGAAELLPARFIFNACLPRTIDGLKSGSLRRRNGCFVLLYVELAFKADRAVTVVHECLSPHDWFLLFFVYVNAPDEPERK